MDYDRLTLYRVTLSHAVCAVYVEGDRVVEIAPILFRLARSVGMSWARLSSVLRHRHGATIATLYVPFLNRA